MYKERLFTSYGRSLYLILKVIESSFDSGYNNKTFFCAKWYVFSERVTNIFSVLLGYIRLLGTFVNSSFDIKINIKIVKIAV